MEKKLTAEEWVKTLKTYSRKNHGINAHLKPRVYYLAYEDVQPILEQYASQECSSKDERIKELEEGLKECKLVLQWHLDKSRPDHPADQSDFFNYTANAINQAEELLTPDTDNLIKN